MTREPDWSLLPAATPAHLRRLIERCLLKDPKLGPAPIAGSVRLLTGLDQAILRRNSERKVNISQSIGLIPVC